MNPVVEERYQFVIWLYLIRKRSKGHHGFLQPDFISIIFGPMIPSLKLTRHDGDIRKAVEVWCDKSWYKNKVSAEVKYGHISDWNTSRVTSMNRLFKKETSFNEDINSWDVSSVTDMGYMFFNATSFKENLNSWDVSSVTNMVGMFAYATSFNSDISEWKISSVQLAANMFLRCPIEGSHKPRCRIR